MPETDTRTDWQKDLDTLHHFAAFVDSIGCSVSEDTAHAALDRLEALIEKLLKTEQEAPLKAGDTVELTDDIIDVSVAEYTHVLVPAGARGVVQQAYTLRAFGVDVPDVVAIDVEFDCAPDYFYYLFNDQVRKVSQ